MSLRVLRALTSQTWIALAIFTGCAVLYGWPLFPKLRNIGNFDDWQEHLTLYSAPIETLKRYLEIPLWNPYPAGGLPTLASPEAGFLSPFLPLYLGWGELVASKLEFLIQLVVAMTGAYGLALEFGAEVFGALFAGIVFGMNGSFALHFRTGHSWHSAMALLPWVLLFFLRSVRSARYWVLCALVLGLTVLLGGIYPTPFSVLSLSLFALVLSVRQQSLAPLKRFSVICLLAFCVVAIRAIPILELMWVHNSRATLATEYLSGSEIFGIFLDDRPYPPNTYFVGFDWAWHEYGHFCGWIPIIFSLGSVTRFSSSRLGLLFFGLTGVILSLGVHSYFSPYLWLHRLPIFGSLHVPPRFLVFSSLAIAVTAGLGLSLLNGLPSVRLRQGLKILLMVASGWQLIDYGQRTFETAFPVRPSVGERKAEFTQISDPARDPQMRQTYLRVLENTGVTNAYLTQFLFGEVQPIGSPKYRGEVYLEGTAGQARFIQWSPNRWTVEVNAQTEGQVIVNQNYEEGWKLKSGAPVSPVRGLISAEVKKGRSTLTFVYRPASVYLGFIVSLIGCGLCFGLWNHRLARVLVRALS